MDSQLDESFRSLYRQSLLQRPQQQQAPFVAQDSPNHKPILVFMFLKWSILGSIPKHLKK